MLEICLCRKSEAQWCLLQKMWFYFFSSDFRSGINYSLKQRITSCTWNSYQCCKETHSAVQETAQCGAISTTCRTTDRDKTPSTLSWDTNAPFTEQTLHLGYPAKGSFTDTKAKVGDLQAVDQAWLLQDESSPCSGKTGGSAVPQWRGELAGNIFQQPTQEAAGVFTANSAPDQTASSTDPLAPILRLGEQPAPRHPRGKAAHLRPS